MPHAACLSVGKVKLCRTYTRNDCTHGRACVVCDIREMVRRGLGSHLERERKPKDDGGCAKRPPSPQPPVWSYAPNRGGRGTIKQPEDRQPSQIGPMPSEAPKGLKRKPKCAYTEAQARRPDLIGLGDLSVRVSDLVT